MQFLNYLQDQRSARHHEEQGRAVGDLDARTPDPAEEGEDDGRGSSGSDRREVNARIVYWGVEGAGKRDQPARASIASSGPTTAASSKPSPTRLDPSVCYAGAADRARRDRRREDADPDHRGAGRPEQAPTRKQLLDRVDGVVFVVDARRERIDDNVASLEELRGALAAYGRALESVPLVVQYNQQDLSRTPTCSRSCTASST